jgi:hypothetical protein
MDEQLNQAYEHIKQGETEQALALLEPYIRANRDSDDAWWLYANAVADSAKKRNALNNILRIGTNPERESKVHYMLAQLDDPFALPDESFAPKVKKGGRSTGFKIFLGIAAMFGVCACVAVFVLVSAAGKMIYAPANYDAQGSIVAGENVTGSVNTEGDWDGYTYSGEAGENLVVTVRPVDGDIAPFVFLYGADGVFVDLSDQNEMIVNRLHVQLPNAGEYTLIVRTFMGVGTGEYSLNLTSD